MTPANYQALRIELDTDPLGLGYAGKTSQQIADILNQVRQAIDRDIGVVPAWRLVAAVNPDEWAALPAQEKQRLALFVSAGFVDTQSANVRSALSAMFGPAAAPLTRAAIAALQSRKGSRAEQLFGAAVTPQDVDYGRVA